MRGQHISVWFFVGTLLVIYGALIFGTGLYELRAPPPVVLANLHASIWWGLLLLVIGAIYLRFFTPNRRNRS
jgi:hypothetical protein